MSAVSLYVTASRMVFQSLDVNESGKWGDINQLISLLRQSLTCCVCGHLLNVPFSSTVSTCQHHICEKCLGGKIRLKPSCSFCKDHSKFAENTHLRILLQSYCKLCRYINSTGIPNKWGSMPISCNTNVNTSSSTSTAFTASHGLGALFSGPTNFYQLIDEGANLSDNFNYSSSSSAATAGNSRESIKENSGLNIASRNHVSFSTGSNGEVKSPATQVKNVKGLIKNNLSSVTVNASTSNAKATLTNGSTTSVAKVTHTANATPLSKKMIKSSPTVRKTQPVTNQMHKVQAGLLNQLDQAVNVTATKPLINSQQSQLDSLTITDISSTVTNVSTAPSSTIATVVQPASHIIPDPSSKVGKVLRLPAALSISAVKTTTAIASNSQTTNSPSFVLAKKGATFASKTLKKTDDGRISLSVLPSGQLAIAASNFSALRNGTSISVPTSSVKILSSNDSSTSIQSKTNSISSTTLPLGFTCVAIDSSGNQINTNVDQSAILMTPSKVETNQLTSSTITTSTTPQSQQFISSNSALKSKGGRRGCRCGLATPNPGKLTCCGQRCPCYVDGKGCYDCKCRGCRNPRKTNSRSGLVVTPTDKMQSQVTSVTPSNQLITNSTASSTLQTTSQLISMPSTLTLSATPTPTSSRTNNLFLSSNINLNSVANGLTLVSTGSSCNEDPLTLPLLDDDPLRSTTVDDDKLSYSMILADD